MKHLFRTPAIALLVAALAVSAVGLRQQIHSETDIVSRAISAPQPDVGVPPIETAVAFWRQRIEEQPADYLSATNLAKALIGEARKTGDKALYNEAETTARTALKLSPTYEPALLAVSAARSANHDFEASLTTIEDVLTRNPTSLGALAARADANFELGNYPLARQQLSELAAAVPNEAALASRLAKQHTVEGRGADAVRLAAQAVLAASEQDYELTEAAFFRFQLGHFLYQSGDVERAGKAVDAALHIDPDHLPSLELKAKVLVARDRLDEAAGAYEALIRRGPAADLHGELAKVYRAVGRTADADAQVERGISLGIESIASFPAERRHLAGFFADFDPPRALEVALADFETRKDIGAYDTLAWAYYVNGRYQDAAQTITGALAQGTQDAALHYHAGMIAKAVGDTPTARRYLESALTINPRFDLTQAPLARDTLTFLGQNR